MKTRVIGDVAAQPDDFKQFQALKPRLIHRFDFIDHEGVARAFVYVIGVVHAGVLDDGFVFLQHAPTFRTNGFAFRNQDLHFEIRPRSSIYKRRFDLICGDAKFEGQECLQEWDATKSRVSRYIPNQLITTEVAELLLQRHMDLNPSFPICRLMVEAHQIMRDAVASSKPDIRSGRQVALETAPESIKKLANAHDWFGISLAFLLACVIVVFLCAMIPDKDKNSETEFVYAIMRGFLGLALIAALWQLWRLIFCLYPRVQATAICALSLLTVTFPFIVCVVHLKAVKHLRANGIPIRLRDIFPLPK